MTNDDRISALSLAKEALSYANASPNLALNPDTGKRKNQGGLAYEKSGGKGPYGAEVGALLLQRNGTYHWNMDDPKNGLEQFDNLYQAMAADVYAPGARQKDRMLIGDERESDIRSGIKTLAAWLDEVWGVTLYRCTSPDRLKNQVIFVTLHPDLIVDPHTGTTAYAQQRIRDEKAVNGQLLAALKRQARLEGEIAREKLKLRAERIIDQLDLPTPRGYLAKNIEQ